MSLEIANTIRKQIGQQALYMLGAKNFAYSKGETFLSFRIRGSKKVNYIKVTLNSMDTYDMEFKKIGKNGVKDISEVNGVYYDQLNSIIEKETGLYTKL